ncbi:MAG: zinc-dependent alcohol dehydrogenase family protein [Acidobacteria bacterium]|nr:zinc-dependent alcohol dehydrogenase family protein [Acidobacteriota bacterium]
MDHLRVQTSQFGPPEEVLELGKARTLLPGPSEVLVALQAAPINPSDLLTIRGVYSARTPLPFTSGFEGVGTLVAWGENVSDLNVGDLVLPLRGQSTWQEHIVAPISYCVRVPEGWSIAESAQLYINPLSAWLMLRQTLTEPQGRWIALNAANSAIGRLLIQLAVHTGARVIAVLRGRNYLSSPVELGASYVVDTKQDSIYSAVMHCTKCAESRQHLTQLVEPLAETWQAHYRQAVRWCITGFCPENLCQAVSKPDTFACAIGSTKLTPRYGRRRLGICSATLNDGRFDWGMCELIQSQISAKLWMLLNNAVETIKCSL